MKRPFDPTPAVRALAGLVLLEPTGTLAEIKRAGGLPANAADCDADAAAVFRAVAIEQAAGRTLTPEGVFTACGLPGGKQDALTDNAPLPSELSALVRTIREALALRHAVQILERTDADLSFKQAELARVLAPLADRGGDTVRPVDAAGWLAEADEPDLPVVCGLFDHGDRVSIVGQSKARKSFFALQLAVSIATGTPFLGVETTGAAVLLVNGEIRPGPYRKRLRRMLAVMQLDADALRDRLSILNSCDATTPATWQSVLSLAMKHRAEVCIIDPAYLLLGDEIDQQQAKENVQSMRAFAAAGVTLVNVYHATKGMIGDRQVIDRVSGSGVYARDASTMLSLCEHATEPDHVVLSAVTRNHPPTEPVTLVFREGAFHPADVAPVERTSRTRTQRTITDESLVACFTTEPANYHNACVNIQRRLAVGIVRSKELLAHAVEAGLVTAKTSGRNTIYELKP